MESELPTVGSTLFGGIVTHSDKNEIIIEYERYIDIPKLEDVENSNLANNAIVLISSSWYDWGELIFIIYSFEESVLGPKHENFKIYSWKYSERDNRSHDINHGKLYGLSDDSSLYFTSEEKAKHFLNLTTSSD